jgi:hypothetical protein
MATTIGDVISRIRNQLKAVKQDPFLTDRYIFSLVSKHAYWLMKREDSKNKLMRFSSVMQTLENVELIEVDKVEACCTSAKSNCTIKRTSCYNHIILGITICLLYFSNSYIKKIQYTPI